MNTVIKRVSGINWTMSNNTRIRDRYIRVRSCNMQLRNVATSNKSVNVGCKADGSWCESTMVNQRHNEHRT
jgi:hypothetical protein